MNDTTDEMPGIEIDYGDQDSDSVDSVRQSEKLTAEEILARANSLFQVDEDTMAEISDPDWITPNLFIRGHMIVIAAEPNGGKTTIVFDCCTQIVRDGFDVYYVNADTAGPEAKQMHADATRAGINLWLPDFAPGQSIESFVKLLTALANAPGSLDGVVIVVDTLKKMLDMTSKSAARERFTLLRRLTAKGATVILLAHTNKHKIDGNPIFEGTGDVKADTDELIYFIPEKRADGSMIVSSDPDKVRGFFEPISFEIGPERDVQLLDEFQDVRSEQLRREQREKDQEVIERITEAIKMEKFKQCEIIEYCKEHRVSSRQSTRVLKDYEGQIWHKENMLQNNAIAYYLF